MNYIQIFISTLFLIISTYGHANEINTNNTFDTSKIRSDESIQITFDHYKHDLYRIYNEALKRDISIQGKTIFRITVNSEGNVVKSMINKSTVKDIIFIESINERISDMIFKKVQYTEDIIFDYPIDFLPPYK